MYIIIYYDVESIEWRTVNTLHVMSWIWDSYEWLVEDMIVTDLADNYKVMVF